MNAPRPVTRPAPTRGASPDLAVVIPAWSERENVELFLPALRESLQCTDIPAALEWFERANGLPGRAHYVPRLVARLRARVGLIEAAL